MQGVWFKEENKTQKKQVLTTLIYLCHERTTRNDNR